MKCVFTATNRAEIGLLKNILRKAGIDCEERNAEIGQLIPGGPFQPELWVTSDENYESATALVREWYEPTRTAGPEWVCPRCGENLLGQFMKCWHCGTHRPELP